MKSKVIKKIRTTIITAAIVMMAAVVIILILENKMEGTGHYTPPYNKLDIENIVADGIKEDEFEKLFFQTGLGKDAVNNIMEEDINPVGELKEYQENFFGDNAYACDRITIITGEEQSVDEEGNKINKFEIQDLKDGDILISLSTHSLGWRHGHAAIVVDSEKGTTLESRVLGEDSEYQYYKKWEMYPTFIQLRINEVALKAVGGDRETSSELLKKTAMEKLNGIPYGLFAGIPVKYIEDIKNTHCAHLVWYAYKEMGIDIDSDKGFFVTPYDMANSDLLEIVQIYGVDPKEYMGDMN